MTFHDGGRKLTVRKFIQHSPKFGLRRYSEQTCAVRNKRRSVMTDHLKCKISCC